MTKTFMPKESEVQRKWHLVDATDKPLGRLADEVAALLRGKNKVIFTPHVDTGDFVVVTNAEKVKLTGAKETQKVYRSYSGFPGGERAPTAAEMRKRHPEHMIIHAVTGMLPRTRQSRQILTRLKVYSGAEHPHEAQSPAPFEI